MFYLLFLLFSGLNSEDFKTRRLSGQILTYCPTPILLAFDHSNPSLEQQDAIEAALIKKQAFMISCVQEARTWDDRLQKIIDTSNYCMHARRLLYEMMDPVHEKE